LFETKENKVTKAIVETTTVVKGSEIISFSSFHYFNVVIIPNLGRLFPILDRYGLFQFRYQSILVLLLIVSFLSPIYLVFEY